MLSPYRNYKEMCDLPFCTDIYTGNERIAYSNKKIRGGTESFSPTDEIRHIELPEWYTFATNSSVHEHCEFNSRKKGYFHFMNFKTAKVKPRMQHFESFIDCIFIKKKQD